LLVKVKVQLMKQRMRGFSLIEVLVALIVVTIGLLGIAKMQAIAYSSTGVASKRSLAAIEAASLAASMHANRAYWSVAGTAPLNTTITGTAIASSDPGLGAGACPTGSTATLTPQELAAYDMQCWATALKALLPNDQATIACQSTAAPTPVSCTVTITWAENLASLNKQEAAAATTDAQAGSPAALQLPSYTLYIQP
jgi:type IV pilus assembly protein PilV